jgi:hypothetical protein
MDGSPHQLTNPDPLHFQKWLVRIQVCPTNRSISFEIPVATICRQSHATSHNHDSVFSICIFPDNHIRRNMHTNGNEMSLTCVLHATINNPFVIRFVTGLKQYTLYVWTNHQLVSNIVFQSLPHVTSYTSKYICLTSYCVQPHNMWFWNRIRRHSIHHFSI